MPLSRPTVTRREAAVRISALVEGKNCEPPLGKGRQTYGLRVQTVALGIRCGDVRHGFAYDGSLDQANGHASIIPVGCMRIVEGQRQTVDVPGDRRRIR